MFALAILIGVYAYGIFALGLLGLLNKSNMAVFTLFILLFSFLISYPKALLMSKINIKGLVKLMLRQKKITKAISLMILMLGLINFIKALTPEISFDALWYHLTLPKLYLVSQRVEFIPGGLLYYSAMPKLTEMIYIAALALGNEILAKIIHFSFGVLGCLALYKISRKYFNHFYSLLAILIFYSNLVVAWQSTVAYVDF